MITAPLSRSTELGLQVYLACLVSFQNHVVAIVFSMLKIHPILKIRISDIFSAYCNHLFNCDLDPKTQLRYWQIITSYQKWLSARLSGVSSAKEFLASPRTKGYRPRSILLYHHALRLFNGFLGQSLKLKIRKPRELPPYCDKGDIEALIAQAERGHK